ncbi:bifunctional 4-hydroxy-2-oxoglutarate aldolase/2-dehydro-3-deoxy-phosphogluconate aldolase [Labedella endophytica]|uniref:2-dehydro-3-deoxy-phosphogluconate aldolase n=1 Tax=Labedella endophytica TaxID=1523160 RepID=A0A3S0XD31_9MICO|nr:bifunctional 4-hydroxy-2-oxoglutarate aldolase/2-dehydro-3-deoxy-phosphogluconate aldolase [Labedella endophytica]RUR03053.1 bifunctional 4-hydroxy-2-oxoglutarate aldolase/2-dehydro-3-deoxy-phosphogluconate aldolase [Labedella endophytica]
MTTDFLTLSPVIPVVVLDDPDAAAPLARALVDGGIRVIELTLRTPRALDCARVIAEEVPEIVLGIGTVRSSADVEASVAAGARFLVSPGSTPGVLSAVADAGVPFLPGVASVTEAMVLAEAGFLDLKFFPAQQAGGAPFLAALSSPLPDLRFCPTGGIGIDTAPDYLALPNVACVGGSWLTPKDAIAAGDWDRVTSLAREAVAELA